MDKLKVRKQRKRKKKRSAHTKMEKILYTEIKRIAENITEKTILYESKNKLYVSHVISGPKGASGRYRKATLEDHAVATLALVEQLNAKFEH